MNASATEGPEPCDVESRVVRFLVWFGIVYAVASLIDAQSWGRIVFTADLNRIMEVPHYYCRAVIELSSIWLLAGCVLVLCRAARSRQILFGWASFVIAMELIQWTAYAFYVGRNDPVWLFRDLLQRPLGLGLPLMLLGVLRIRSDRTLRGFSVVTSGSRDEPGPVEVVSGSFSRQLLRWTMLVALVLGVIGTVHAATGADSWGDGSAWRMAMIKTLRQLRVLSWILLLGGAIVVWFKPLQGQRLMMGWAMLFILLSVSIGLLYDVLYVYWQAVYGPGRVMWTVRNAAYHIQAGLQASAFAIISLYVLWQLPQPGEPAADSMSQQTARGMVNDPGGIHT